ncbi:MAG: hypothetical protein M0Z51_01230 [Propionibacterium sp.]|nr:hypothetical protein [Propionibacterium sp.]
MSGIIWTADSRWKAKCPGSCRLIGWITVSAVGVSPISTSAADGLE